MTNTPRSRKPKAPNGPHGEQINRAIEITGWEFKKLAGLTRGLDVQQIFDLNNESKNSVRLWKWLLDNKYKKNMTLIMKQKLQEHPDFRERKNKNLFLAKWTMREVFEEKDERDENGNLQKKKTTLLDKQKRMEVFTLNDFARFGQKFSSLDRDWRDTLRDNKELRGSDYEEKDELEEKKLNSLGYRN